MKVHSMGALLALFLLLSCAASGNNGSDSDIDDQDDDTTVSQYLKEMSEKIVKLKNDFVKIEDQVEKCGFEKYQDPKSPCFLVDVAFSPAKPSEASVGKRILILDREMTYFGATIHKRKVLGLYQFKPSDGQLERYPYDLFENEDKYKIPTFYYNIHSKVIGESENKIPAKSLRPIFKKYVNNLQGAFVNPYSNEYDLVMHPSFGLHTLNFLADHVPDAQFVLVNEQPGTFFDISLPNLCNIRNIPNDRINSMMQQKLKHVGDLVQKYGISFIIAPTTMKKANLIKTYQEYCSDETEEDDIDKLTVLYDAIAAYRNGLAEVLEVVVFQSSPETQDNSEHYTCRSIGHRIVTSSTRRDGIYSDIPKGGSRELTKYVDKMSATDCTDVFVNMARPMFTEDFVDFTPSFSFLEHNDYTDGNPERYGSTRLSAAVALAYSIFLLENGSTDLAGLKRKLKSELVVSPIQHRQTLACSSDESYCSFFHKYYE